MSLLGKLIEPVTGIIEKFIPDADKKQQIAFELATLADKQLSEELKVQAEIVKAEANSEHWLVAAWRPILMLVITAVVAVHYLVFPLFTLFGYPLELELPSELWNLLTVGVGGYVVGRSGEKMMKEYKK